MDSTSPTNDASILNDVNAPEHATESEEFNNTHQVRADATNPNYIPMTERTFTCFGKLPLELRMVIWGFPCFHERNVFIWLTKPFGNMTDVTLIWHDLDDDPDLFNYVTTTPPPAVLHTCQESRKAGLDHYYLLFGAKFRIGYSEILTPEHIYANPETDRMFCMGKLYSKDLHKFLYWPMEKIAFSTDVIQYGVS
jgi:hypothetical protein